MKRTASLLLVMLLTIQIAICQTAINTDNSDPDASAMLDVKATDRGILIPRMTETERDNIASPATGLLVFVTTDNMFYYYDGSAWTSIGEAEGEGWIVSGDSLYTKPDSTLTVRNSRVGIGNVDPQFDLDIASDHVRIKSDPYAQLSMVTGNTSGWMGANGNSGFMYFGAYTSSDLRFLTSNAQRMTIDEAGNVGIGTNDPGYTFHIYKPGSTGATMAHLGDGTYGFRFEQGSGVGFHSRMVSRASGHEGNGLELRSLIDPGIDSGIWPLFSLRAERDNYTAIQNRPLLHVSNAGEVKLAISNDGNTGVNTSTPTHTMDVNGEARVRTLNLDNSINSIVVADASGVLHTREVASLGGAGGAWAVNGSHIYNTNTGNVGIGLNNPSYNLHVRASNATMAVQDVNSNVTARFVALNSGLWVVTEGTASSDDIYLAPATTFAMVLKEGGNVAIGTSNPGGYKFYVNGTAYSTGGWIGSDKKFKKEIEPISGALDKLTEVNGVSYLYRQSEFEDKNFPEGRHFGVIAQDIEKVFPEVVMEGPGNDKAVSYTELVPVLIEAVKELKAENDDLRNRIEELERREAK